MIGIIRHETSYTTEGKDEPNIISCGHRFTGSSSCLIVYTSEASEFIIDFLVGFVLLNLLHCLFFLDFFFTLCDKSSLRSSSLSYTSKLILMGRLRTKFYDKRDNFNFPIVNFQFICSNIPAAPAYGVYLSQLIQYFRACGSYQDFLSRILHTERRQENSIAVIANM
jgi:hypothetical protein